MILATKKLTFNKRIEVKLPEGSIPIEIKKGKGKILTLWYWDNEYPPEQSFTFKLYKQEDESFPDNEKYLGSVFKYPDWFQVYQV